MSTTHAGHKPDAFIVAATLPPELAYWVGHWACNPAGVPKPIREDEFGHLDLGNLDVWLWSRTVAPETYKGKFILPCGTSSSP